jgi:hypothetical protein
MSFDIASRVPVAIDPEVSLGRFAMALNQAGYRMQVAGGMLCIRELPATAPAAKCRRKATRRKARAA